MDYRSELEFAKRILMQMNVPCLVLSSGELPPDSLDLGLRAALGRTAPLRDRLRDPIVKALAEKTIVCQVDEFSCRYVFVPLRERVFIAGPYTDVNVDSEWLRVFLLRSGIHSDWRPLLEHYYQQVCYLEDDRMLLATMQALAEHIWGPMQFWWSGSTGASPKAGAVWIHRRKPVSGRMCLTGSAPSSAATRRKTASWSWCAGAGPKRYS